MVTQVEELLDGSPLSSSGEAHDIRLTITVSRNQTVAEGQYMAYRLQITATSTTEFDTNIFVFESQSPSNGEENPPLEFVSVATAPYMEELPITTPDEDSRYMCRLSSIDLYFPSASEVDDAITAIKRRVLLLLQDMEALSTTVQSQTVDYTFTAPTD